VSQVVLLILAVVWAIFLVPQVLRARATRTGDSVGAFAQQLSILGRTSPAGSPHLMRPLPMGPVHDDDDDLGPSRMTLGEARKRRKEVIRALLIAMAVTFVLGLLPPLRKLLLLNLLLDAAFVAYLVLLYRAQSATADRHARTRRLRAPAPPPHRDDLLPRDERTYADYGQEPYEDEADEDEVFEVDEDDTGDPVRILQHTDA
jgi:hypothetical protein